MKLRTSNYWGALMLLLFAGLCSIMAVPVSAADTEGTGSLRPWQVSLQTKYFFQSHTSYEFGNPFSPRQGPLSRLEFPLNSWWAGASLRREFSRFSVGAEVFRNLSSEAMDVMTDSDWDDDDLPDLRTIYSESPCRMEASYIVRGDVDMKISDWIGLPRWFDLRPVIGLTWQRFSMVTHDGVQYNLTPDGAEVTPLPGNGIRFEQTYWQLSAGLKAAFDLGQPFQLARLRLLTQMDWAYIDAGNEDYHVLRAGRRLTYEKTTGHAWHALASLKIGLTQNLNAAIGAEYQFIATTGSHRLVNEPFGMDFRFEKGVRVWSEQISMTMGLEYSF
ncbi:MAG: omptin family outer membrane protease [Deltaproteobacteria bacterium]